MLHFTVYGTEGDVNSNQKRLLIVTFSFNSQLNRQERQGFFIPLLLYAEDQFVLFIGLIWSSGMPLFLYFKMKKPALTSILAPNPRAI